MNSSKGPWTYSGIDINPTKGIPGISDHTIKAQENFVFTVPHAGTGDADYVYTGDMWTSAPDKMKSHDFQYWEPLAFDDTKSPPTIAPLSWVDSFTINPQQQAAVGTAADADAARDRS